MFKSGRNPYITRYEKPFWTEIDREVLRLHFASQSTRSLNELFPTRSYNAVRHQARRMGLLKDDLYHVNRKFPPKSSFWSDWSPNLAYVLGLILTDGSIQSRPKSSEVIIRLRTRDENVLHDIARCAGGYSGLRELDAFWRCSGKDVVQWVIDRGLAPDKLFRAALPECPSELMPHLIRGLYDGDGYFCVRKNRSRVVGVAGLVGQPALLSEVKATLRQLGIIQSDTKICPDLRARCSGWQLSLPSDVTRLVHWLYDNEPLCIATKRDQALQAAHR